MANFFQLVANENMKIYRRVYPWVLLGIALALSLIVTILFISFNDGFQTSMWTPFEIVASMTIGLATVFTVVVAAESVAGEFSAGTIKLLLIRPWSRSKILLSKYIALLLFALAFVVVMFIWNLLLNGIFFGFDFSETRGDYSVFAYFLLLHGLELIGLLVIVTLAFLVSTVFRIGWLAIVLALLIVLGGQTITSILIFFDYAWIKYLLFLNLNLSQYIMTLPEGIDLPGTDGMSMGFSLAVLAVHYVVFVVVTWLVFNKRDVAGS